MAREFGLVVHGLAVPFNRVASWNGMHEYVRPLAFNLFLLKHPTVDVLAHDHAGRKIGRAALHTDRGGLWFETLLQDHDVRVCQAILTGASGVSVNFTRRISRAESDGDAKIEAVYAAEIDHIAIACDSAVYAPHGATCWRSDVGYDALPGWRVQVMEDAWWAARRAYRAPPRIKPRPPHAAAPALVTNSASRPFRRFPNAAGELARIEQHFRDYPVTPLPPVRAAKS